MTRLVAWFWKAARWDMLMTCVFSGMRTSLISFTTREAFSSSRAASICVRTRFSCLLRRICKSSTGCKGPAPERERWKRGTSVLPRVPSVLGFYAPFISTLFPRFRRTVADGDGDAVADILLVRLCVTLSWRGYKNHLNVFLGYLVISPLLIVPVSYRTRKSVRS